jgi:hypothetical protein
LKSDENFEDNFEDVFFKDKKAIYDKLTQENKPSGKIILSYQTLNGRLRVHDQTSFIAFLN